MSKVYFIDCIIKDNSNIRSDEASGVDGGAGYIYNSHVVFDRCQITDNEAEANCWTKGGAFLISQSTDSSNPTDTEVKFINSVIARNSVTLSLIHI